MTETKRTTVTLGKIYMDMIDELIGVFGTTQAAVINNIVKHFFNDSHNDNLLLKLKRRKREKNPPAQEVLEQKIQNLLKGVNVIKLSHFLSYLEIERNYFLENLDKWKKMYGFKLEYDKIIKI
ncbi:MAG: hypothetical protein P8Y97_12905 [Candidatus Lokiarchaeota archaeon]